MDKNARIRVHLASIEEAALISSILHASFIEFKPLYTASAFSGTTPATDEIIQRWHEGPVWVASLDNYLAGTVSAVPEGNTLYIRSMAVVPAARGQGVGYILLHEIERFARSDNFKRLYLFTTPFLYDAIQLYTGFGFILKDEGEVWEGMQVLKMEKRLV